MKKILIVEDEKILAEMYRDVFTREGFDVHSAFTEKEALELAATGKPDLILLDILLPEANGISFLKEKNKRPAIASIPVIAFSNFDDIETKREAFQLGVQDYLIKTNYTPQQIVSRVNEYVQKIETEESRSKSET
ncbi:MAG: response regulator [Patescibacteria group bacterium]